VPRAVAWESSLGLPGAADLAPVADPRRAPDLAELTGLCDRVLIFQHGRIVDTLDGDRLSEHGLSMARPT
jgi:hypothetical protein